jgi:small subunit ribosomal protein S20
VPNLPSAKKRGKQNERRCIRNRARKAAVKTESRKFLDLLHEGDVDAATAAFSKVTKKLDQVAAKGTLHKNTVARRKSRLARRLNAAVAEKKG